MNEKKTISINNYTSCDTKEKRIEYLENMKHNNESIDISLAQNILELKISTLEKSLIIDLVDDTNNLALEDFLTKNLLYWDQDLAVAALIRWSKTEHRLWFRLVALCRSNIIPQRLLYTIVEYSWCTGGKLILDIAVNKRGLEELSNAYHSKLLNEHIYWNKESELLEKIALNNLDTVKNTCSYIGDGIILSSILYLAKFKKNKLKDITQQLRFNIWVDMIRGILAVEDIVDTNSDFKKAISKVKTRDSLYSFLTEFWPYAWNRQELLPANILLVIEKMNKYNVTINDDIIDRKFFGGINENNLFGTLIYIKKSDDFIKCFNKIESFLTVSDEICSALKVLFKKHLNNENIDKINSKWKNVASISLGIELHNRDIKLQKELDNTLTNEGFTPLANFISTENKSTQTYFFDVAYRNKTVELEQNFTDKDDLFFDTLLKNWISPKVEDLNKLAESARKNMGIFKLCYIHTLGRFNSKDEAVLKLLDFIHTKNDEELYSIVHSLSNINTTKSIHQMISMITRISTPRAISLEICNLLKNKNVTNLQAELKSTISSLETFKNIKNINEINEIQDNLRLLITPTTKLNTKSEIKSEDKYNLDDILKNKISLFNELSSEVKRALRTAQFFNIQVLKEKDVDSIDLSPIIDMQYKSLELLFREMFESACKQEINNGTIQRKLDVIGYARPLKNKMDEFESYISKLDVIRDIPFFSKFKLRKILRAISLYRPGKRFTLDSIKAFGIFFLIFGRQECKYNLAQSMQLGFKSDTELFKYIKMLHTMQDARNRAAHEGFHPDEANNIDAIWQQTERIIAGAYEIHNHLMTQNFSTVKKSTDDVIIEHKRAS